MTTNGNLSGSDGGASQAAVARAVLTSMQKTKDLAGAPMPTGENSLKSVIDALEGLVNASPELRAAVEETMARSMRQALAFTNAPVPAIEDLLAMMRAKSIGTKTKGGTVARAFWWGFHIEISHEDLQAFLGGANAVNTIVGAIGGGVPSPAAPFIALAAAFIAAALGVLAALDRGRGVYVSMLWIFPGVFVPTSVV